MNVISDRDYKESGMYAKEQAEVQTVPIHCKVALTIKEAAEYSNIVGTTKHNPPLVVLIILFPQWGIS